MKLYCRYMFLTKNLMFFNLKEIEEENLYYCVIIQSLKVSDAVYESNWLNLNKNKKLALRMIMLKASKPIIFKLGGILQLSLDTFTQVRVLLIKIILDAPINKTIEKLLSNFLL